MHLDHVTIRTQDITGTLAFFKSVFDLRVGPRPQILQRFPGHWLYAGNDPIVHIILSNGDDYALPAEAIDHVGFRLHGYDTFCAKLKCLGVSFSTMDIEEIQERRLFFRSPGGPLLEAVFSEPVPMSNPE